MPKIVDIYLKTITLEDFFKAEYCPCSDLFSMKKDGKSFQLELVEVPEQYKLESEGCIKLLILNTKELIEYDKIPKQELIEVLKKCFETKNQEDCTKEIQISKYSSIQCKLHFEN